MVDNAGDKIVEAQGSGFDTALCSTSYSLSATASVEAVACLGNSRINLTGNNFSQRLTGNSAGNTLLGLGGNDMLYGEDGPDRLVGGLGNDVLYGGKDSYCDTFVFNTLLNSKLNLDRIADFNPRFDRVQLDDAIFQGVGAVGRLTAAAFRAGACALDSSDRVTYDPVSGSLSFDKDGTGPAASIKFAVLSPKLALSEANFLII